MFYYLPKDVSQTSELLFSIEQIGKADWADWEDTGFFTVLGTRNDQVYALHKPSENPYAATESSTAYKETQEMLTQLKTSIRFTFNADKQSEHHKDVILILHEIMFLKNS